MAVFNEEVNSIIVFVRGSLAGEVNCSGPLSLAGEVRDTCSAGKVDSARRGSESKPLRVCALLDGQTVLTFHLKIFQPVKEKPASPSRMKILNEKESHRDMPPDKPSAAQPVTGVPASGSRLVQSKRSLPVPYKVRGGLQGGCGQGPRWAVYAWRVSFD